MTAVLEIEQVARTYGSGHTQVRALDGVSLAVAAVAAGLAVPMLLGAMTAQSAAWERDYAPRELRANQVLVDSPAATAEVTKLVPGARQAPFTYLTANATNSAPCGPAWTPRRSRGPSPTYCYQLMSRACGRSCSPC